MWPFTKNKASARTALGSGENDELKEAFEAHYAATGFPVAGIRLDPQPDGGSRITMSAEEFVFPIDETPRETIKAPDVFSVSHHVEQISAILETVANRRQSLVEQGRLEREDFERAEAERARQIAELDGIAAAYNGALKVAAPGGADGYGTSKFARLEPETQPAPDTAVVEPIPNAAKPVDPDRLDEVGRKIARTRSRRKAEPIENAK